MLHSILETIAATDTTAATTVITTTTFLICTLASLVLGVCSGLLYMFRNTYTKGFVMTLAVLPAMIQVVIMMVNGNLGTGVAVMGAFGLVRFRSVAGSAREIAAVFLAMAVGLATGMGYIGLAAVFFLIIALATMIFVVTGFGEEKTKEQQLKITIPESLDYTGVFDDLFRSFAKKTELVKVKTTNMGSLYELDYHIVLKEGKNEKNLLDQIRCRNGNLTVSLGRVAVGKESL